MDIHPMSQEVSNASQTSEDLLCDERRSEKLSSRLKNEHQLEIHPSITDPEPCPEVNYPRCSTDGGERFQKKKDLFAEPFKKVFNKLVFKNHDIHIKSRSCVGTNSFYLSWYQKPQHDPKWAKKSRPLALIGQCSHWKFTVTRFRIGREFEWEPWDRQSFLKDRDEAEMSNTNRHGKPQKTLIVAGSVQNIADIGRILWRRSTKQSFRLVSHLKLASVDDAFNYPIPNGFRGWMDHPRCLTGSRIKFRKENDHEEEAPQKVFKNLVVKNHGVNIETRLFMGETIFMYPDDVSICAKKPWLWPWIVQCTLCSHWNFTVKPFRIGKGFQWDAWEMCWMDNAYDVSEV